MAQYAAAATARDPQAMPARTTAEQGLIDAFARELAKLPGSGWVARVRTEAMATFAAAGLPTTRGESWRYTNIRDRWKEAHVPSIVAATSVDASAIETALGPLAQLDADRIVLVDGAWRPELSRTDGLSGPAEVMPLAPLLAKAPAWLEVKFAPGRLAAADTVTALNTALMTDGVLLKIMPGEATTRPILLIHVRAAAAPSTITTRSIVAIEAGARATLIEVYVSLPGAAPASTINALTDIALAADATLHHLKVAAETPQALLLSHWGATIAAGATYRAYQLTLGAGLTRHGLNVLCAGPGSTIDISGAFLCDGASHVDTTMLIDHAAPSCTSRELFKGVLADRAHGVFQGKVIVRPGAQKTDGKQMAQALLLSPDAEFDSKPELEIYADDVVCGHGSTAAELDDDHIFYLQARGIPAPLARAMLTRAFVAETLDKIDDEALRASLAAMMDHWLDQRAARWAGERT